MEHAIKSKLTFPQTNADSDGCENQAERGDDDEQNGPEPESHQDSSEPTSVPAVLGGAGVVDRQSGRRVLDGGGAGVVVSGHFQIVVGVWCQSTNRISRLWLQIIGH